MVATFNYHDYPNVKILLGENITSDNDFKSITTEWLNLYDQKKNFTLEFDTKELKYVNIKYCLYMTFFIKKLKNKNPQYLQKSKIYIYNNYIFKLAKYIFYIEKPVALVELIYNSQIIIVKP